MGEIGGADEIFMDTRRGAMQYFREEDYLKPGDIIILGKEYGIRVFLLSGLNAGNLQDILPHKNTDFYERYVSDVQFVVIKAGNISPVHYFSNARRAAHHPVALLPLGNDGVINTDGPLVVIAQDMRGYGTVVSPISVSESPPQKPVVLTSNKILLGSLNANHPQSLDDKIVGFLQTLHEAADVARSQKREMLRRELGPLLVGLRAATHEIARNHGFNNADSFGQQATLLGQYEDAFIDGACREELDDPVLPRSARNYKTPEAAKAVAA